MCFHPALLQLSVVQCPMQRGSCQVCPLGTCPASLVHPSDRSSSSERCNALPCKLSASRAMPCCDGGAGMARGAPAAPSWHRGPHPRGELPFTTASPRTNATPHVFLLHACAPPPICPLGFHRCPKHGWAGPVFVLMRSPWRLLHFVEAMHLLQPLHPSCVPLRAMHVCSHPTNARLLLS